MLIRDINAPVNRTCEGCIVLLEYDADLLANSAPLDEIHPAASYHLSLCSKCSSGIDEWLRFLGAGNTARDPGHRGRRKSIIMFVQFPCYSKQDGGHQNQHNG